MSDFYDEDDFSEDGDDRLASRKQSKKAPTKKVNQEVAQPAPKPVAKKAVRQKEVANALPAPPQASVNCNKLPDDAFVEKAKLVPADRVFHRIFWNVGQCCGADDERLVAMPRIEDFDLGYEDRFKGVLFLPVTKFRHTGDETSEIPFHRVRVFRFKKIVVWDREHRIDRLDSVFDGTLVSHPPAHAQSARTGDSREEDRSPPCLLQAALASKLPLQSLTFIPRENSIADGSSSVKAAAADDPVFKNRLKIATFNILFDLFIPHMLHTHRRIPLIARELESLDADVVCLQEVTPALFDAIRCASPILRQRYVWTNLPRSVNSCQCILSKLPIAEAGYLALSRNKFCVFAFLCLPNYASRVAVAACHLISDYGGEASVDRRVEELAKIFSVLKPFPMAILMGDFNFGDDNPEQQLVQWPSRFADCYLSTAQKAAGGARGRGLGAGQPTFDLVRNWIADLNCKTHRYPRRLDRILCAGFRVAGTTSLFGDTPSLVTLSTSGGENDDASKVPSSSSSSSPTHISLFPSDHFGVWCFVMPDDSLAAPPTQQHHDPRHSLPDGSSPDVIFRIPPPLLVAPSQRCAVCILPPPNIAAMIDVFREQWDPAFSRWMPHINLLWPFVAHEHIPSAIDKLDKLLVHRPMFRMTIGKTAVFPGTRKPVVFLSISSSSHRDVDTIGQIAKDLRTVFPTCGRSASHTSPDHPPEEMEEKAPAEFTPHLTIARCPSVEASRAIRAQVDSEWSNVEFLVDRIYLIAHYEGSSRFEVVHEIPLRPDEADPHDAVSVGGPNSGTSSCPTTSRCVTVLEDAHWGHKKLVPYVPSDTLEQWALSVSVEAFARSAPTHISQRGGMYHIPSDRIDDYLAAWNDAVQHRDKEPFYLEEVRGNPFRLYIDIDIKRTVELPYDASDLLQALCQRVSELLELRNAHDSPINSSCPTAEAIGGNSDDEAVALVTECHGPHRDAAVGSTARFKSGFRMYFQRIFVDAETYCQIIRQLSSDLEGGLLNVPLPSHLASSTSSSPGWRDVLDDGAIGWDRGRLFGTIKRRRNQQRAHSFAGIVGPGGLRADLTVEYQRMPLRVLYGQVLRVWESPPSFLASPQATSANMIGNAFSPSLLRKLRRSP